MKGTHVPIPTLEQAATDHLMRGVQRGLGLMCRDAIAEQFDRARDTMLAQVDSISLRFLSHYSIGREGMNVRITIDKTALLDEIRALAQDAVAPEGAPRLDDGARRILAMAHAVLGEIDDGLSCQGSDPENVGTFIFDLAAGSGLAERITEARCAIDGLADVASLADVETRDEQMRQALKEAREVLLETRGNPDGENRMQVVSETHAIYEIGTRRGFDLRIDHALVRIDDVLQPTEGDR